MGNVQADMRAPPAGDGQGRDRGSIRLFRLDGGSGDTAVRGEGSQAGQL